MDVMNIFSNESSGIGSIMEGRIVESIIVFAVVER